MGKLLACSHNKYMNKADYHGGITASGAFHLAMFQYVRKITQPN